MISARSREFVFHDRDSVAFRAFPPQSLRRRGRSTWASGPNSSYSGRSFFCTHVRSRGRVLFTGAVPWAFAVTFSVWRLPRCVEIRCLTDVASR
jgi:hypothetical protein